MKIDLLICAMGIGLTIFLIWTGFNQEPVVNWEQYGEYYQAQYDNFIDSTSHSLPSKVIQTEGTRVVLEDGSLWRQKYHSGYEGFRWECISR